MSCQRFDDLLAESAVRTLDEAEHAEFDGHLALCGGCVDRLRGHVLTTRLLQGLKAHEEVEPVRPLRAGVVERILEAMRAVASGQHGKMA